MILKNLSIDCVIFGFDGENLNVLLWHPDLKLIEDFFKDKEDFIQAKELFEKNPLSFDNNIWGLIGAHVPFHVNADDHAKHILSTFTGLDNIFLRQVKTFNEANRVQYERVVTIAYYALINPEYHLMKKLKSLKALKWFNIKKIPDLIFDHKEIITEALEKLQGEVKYHPVGFHLLPDRFTLTQLQKLYEIILDTKLDTRNFRKKILNMKLLSETDEKQKNVAHRAARLYEFNLEIYNKLVKEGLNFRI